ncbi:MAG: hypothetical protein ACKOHM_03520 [Spartobacteria bacterium]
MILSIALTQFVFISLGILSVNVLLKAGGYAANVAERFPAFPVWMATHGLWLFALPLAWVAFAGFCLHFGRGPLPQILARTTGVVLAMAIFAAYFTAAYLLF